MCHYTGGVDGGGYCEHPDTFVWLLFIPALIVSWLGSFTKLSFTSVVGILCAVVSMTLMFGYMGKKLATDDTAEGKVELFDLRQTNGHIGLAMLVFEGNGSIINVRAESKNP